MWKVRTSKDSSQVKLDFDDRAQIVVDCTTFLEMFLDFKGGMEMCQAAYHY
jgi:hypothetical protein